MPDRSAIYCGACGHPNPLGAGFCGQCGGKLHPREERRAPAALKIAAVAPSKSFLGRADLLAAVPPLALDALNRRGRLLAVTGTKGIGKTALIRQAVPFLSANGFHVEYLEGEPGYAALAFYPLWELVVRAARIDELAAPEAVPRKLEQLKKIGLSDIDIHYLAHLLPGPIAERGARRLDDEARLEGLTTAMVHLLQRLSRVKPLALIVDHLHYADRFTKRLLHRLPAMLDRERLFVIAGSRAGDDLPETSEIVHRLHLPGLPLRDLIALARAYVGGQRLPQEIEENLETVSDGEPLRVLLLLDYLREKGYLKPQRDGFRVDEKLRGLEFPHAVESILAARFEMFKPHHAELLALVSILSGECTVKNLQALYPHHKYLQEDLKELIGLRLLRVTTDKAVQRVRFSHHALHEFIYGRIIEITRRTLHDKVAAHLKTTPAVRVWLHDWTVFFHSASGSERAASQARDFEGQCDELARRLQFTLAGLGYQALSQAWQKLGQTRQEGQFVYPFKLAMTLDKLARGYRARGEYERAEKSYQALLGLAHQLNAVRLALETLFKLADLHIARGDLEQARHCGEQALSLAEGHGEPFALARVHYRLGEWNRLRARWDDAQHWLNAAWEASGDRQDAIAPSKRWRAELLLSQGLLSLDQRHYDQALKPLVRAMDEASEKGDVGVLVTALERLSLLYGYRKEYERALGFVALGQRLGRTLGAGRFLANLAYFAGRLYEMRSDARDASLAYRESAEFARECLWTAGIERGETALHRMVEEKSA